MDDMADILQIRGSPSPPATENKPASKLVSAATKKKGTKGMSREVLALMSDDARAAANSNEAEIPSSTGRKFTINPAFKTRAWQWEKYHNSARADGVRLKHWMRKPVVVDDYPFARFNKPVYVVSYTDSQYDESLKVASWSKEETDLLVASCRRFDCRWPLIHDRWPNQPDWPKRSITDLRERYFSIAKTLVSRYKEEEMLGGRAVDASMAKLTADARAAIKSFTFDGEEEKEKSTYVDLQFHRTKDSDAEIARLQADIQKLDSDAKKLRIDRKKVEEKQRSDEKRRRKKAIAVIAAAQAAASIAPVLKRKKEEALLPVATTPSPITPEFAKKSTASAKKLKVDREELGLEELPAAIESILGTYSASGEVFKRSTVCRALKTTDSTIPLKSTELELHPKLGPLQMKSLEMLLAKKEGDNPPLCTNDVCNAFMQYQQDAVRLIVTEYALKKKKNEVRNAKLRLKKLMPSSESGSVRQKVKDKKNNINQYSSSSSAPNVTDLSQAIKENEVILSGPEAFTLPLAEQVQPLSQATTMELVVNTDAAALMTDMLPPVMRDQS